MNSEVENDSFPTKREITGVGLKFRMKMYGDSLGFQKNTSAILLLRQEIVVNSLTKNKEKNIEIQKTCSTCEMSFLLLKSSKGISPLITIYAMFYSSIAEGWRTVSQSQNAIYLGEEAEAYQVRAFKSFSTACESQITHAILVKNLNHFVKNHYNHDFNQFRRRNKQTARHCQIYFVIHNEQDVLVFFEFKFMIYVHERIQVIFNRVHDFSDFEDMKKTLFYVCCSCIHSPYWEQQVQDLKAAVLKIQSPPQNYPAPGNDVRSINLIHQQHFH
uniref:Uncharacterized protein n=1 Tax=Glossina pallidipes TaxID=7398 RepID=A0A1A9ZUC1_GLOPL